MRALFDAPTVALLAPLLSENGARREPLGGRRAARGGSVVVRPEPTVVPRPIAGRGRDLQHADRVCDQRAIGFEALGAALDDVIARHESLRTVFPDTDGVPFQQVLPARSGMWRRGDAAVVSLPEQDVAGELMSLAGHRFDLSTDIPIRVQIYSVGPEQHVVGIVVHHIAFDGWSLAPMVRDISAAYQARQQRLAPDWAPLPVQYVDYTLWQRTQFGDLDDGHSPIAAQLAYWRDALAGMPERLELPTDRPYPAVADQRGASVPVDWPAELQQRVREVAAEYNATSFMVMQAGVGGAAVAAERQFRCGGGVSDRWTR